MQKIAPDKVNVIECDAESASVTINFFPKSNLVHYYALTMELWENSVVWKSLYKIVYQNVQENIIILNVTNVCVQTKVFDNIKFCCLIITPFVS